LDLRKTLNALSVAQSRPALTDARRDAKRFIKKRVERE
jgi:hypothetical protein